MYTTLWQSLLGFDRQGQEMVLRLLHITNDSVVEVSRMDTPATPQHCTKQEINYIMVLTDMIVEANFHQHALPIMSNIDEQM